MEKKRRWYSEKKRRKHKEVSGELAQRPAPSSAARRKDRAKKDKLGEVWEAKGNKISFAKNWVWPDERRRLLGFYIISMLFVSPSQFQKQIDHAIGQEQMNSAPRKMQIGGFNWWRAMFGRDTKFLHECGSLHNKFAGKECAKTSDRYVAFICLSLISKFAPLIAFPNILPLISKFAPLIAFPNILPRPLSSTSRCILWDPASAQVSEVYKQLAVCKSINLVDKISHLRKKKKHKKKARRWRGLNACVAQPPIYSSSAGTARFIFITLLLRSLLNAGRTWAFRL